jgi:alkylation response protein AidB-like acyl-CoA dehydrogenase
MIYNAPTKDMLFLLNEWLGLDKLTALPGNEDFDADLLEAVLEEAGKFCSTELLPLNQTGDEHGAVYENGEVRTPPGFKEAYARFIENGWTGIDSNPEHGGQGLPKVVCFLIDEMLGATNLSFKLYSELSHGAYHLLDSVASDEIRDRYLPKMVEGVWSGTMCLTEPQCGTDLGLLTTKAVPVADGMHEISGSKIFITSGDHDLTENILHLVIARIDGAPEGTGHPRLRNLRVELRQCNGLSCRRRGPRSCRNVQDDEHRTINRWYARTRFLRNCLSECADLRVGSSSKQSARTATR